MNQLWYIEQQYLWKLVDILISKNQALQILYLKHHVYKTSQIIMGKKFNKIHER